MNDEKDEKEEKGDGDKIFGKLPSELTAKIQEWVLDRTKEERVIEVIRDIIDPDEFYENLTDYDWGLRLPEDFVFPENPTDANYETVYMESFLGDIQIRAREVGGLGNHLDIMRNLIGDRENEGFEVNNPAEFMSNLRDYINGTKYEIRRLGEGRRGGYNFHIENTIIPIFEKHRDSPFKSDRKLAKTFFDLYKKYQTQINFINGFITYLQNRPLSTWTDPNPVREAETNEQRRQRERRNWSNRLPRSMRSSAGPKDLPGPPPPKGGAATTVKAGPRFNVQRTRQDIQHLRRQMAMTKRRKFLARSTQAEITQPQESPQLVGGSGRVGGGVPRRTGGAVYYQGGGRPSFMEPLGIRRRKRRRHGVIG